RERLPTFGTSHPEVHGVFAVRAQIDRASLLEMDIQPATGGAETADRGGRIIRFQTRWNFAQSEVAGVQDQILRLRSVPLPHHRFQLARDPFHDATPPGMRGASAAAKQKYLSRI